MQQNRCSSADRTERERESLHLKDWANWNEYRSNCHISNGFHSHLPISIAGLDDLDLPLTNPGMFGTYIRGGSQSHIRQGLCNLIHTSPMKSESGRPIACRTVAIINKFLQPRQALLESMLVLQQQEHRFRSHRMYMYPSHRKAIDAAVDLLRHRGERSPHCTVYNNFFLGGVSVSAKSSRLTAFVQPIVPQARLCKHAISLLAWFPVIILLS